MEPRWTINKTALFRDLGYEPHAGQRPIHESRARYRIVACGARFGKSTASAMEAVVELLLPRPTSYGWLIAPAYELTDYIFVRVAQCVEQHLKHRIKELDERGRRIVLRNLAGGLSTLECKSADYPVTLLGAACHWMIADEAARLRPEIWSQYLVPRLLDHKGTALLVSTPNGKNWFWQQYRRGQSSAHPDYQSWSMPTLANPRIDPQLVEAERTRLSPDTFAQEYGGEFVGPHEERCERCGAPDESAPTIVIDGKAPEQADCPDCGWPVSALTGRTLVSRFVDGRPCPRILITGCEQAGAQEAKDVVPPIDSSGSTAA